MNNSTIDASLYDNEEDGWGEVEFYPFETELVQCPPNSTSGSTYVSGFISANITWTLVGSPYIVIGDVIVEEGVELTIEPGVTVKFDSRKNLIIDGILNAVGNAVNKITFTSNATTPASGDWGTIKFRDLSDDSKCTIDFGRVEYGTTGIAFESCSPSILNSTIWENKFDGVFHDKYGRPYLAWNIISNNGRDGIFADGVSGFEAVGNTISNNGRHGICIHGSGSTRLRENQISNNSGSGIKFGIGYQTFIAEHNTICNNTGSGVVGGFPPEGSVILQYNNIFNNTPYVVRFITSRTQKSSTHRVHSKCMLGP